MNGKEDKQDEAESVDFSSLIKETPEDKAMLVREFRQKFEELLAETNIKRLIVLIDDLDRCSPERLIENLEAIKLFLNVPRTAFVIGADPRIVKHAIEYRYKSRITSDEPMDADTKTERISNQFVKDYLEKLIQVPYHLPRLSDPEVETYLSLLFCEKNLPLTTHQKVLSKFSEFRTANRYGAFGFADINSLLTPAEADKLKQNAPLITSLGPVITEGLNGNPRQIKRFLNSFTLRTRLATVAKITSLRLDVLGKLMVLEYIEPDLFRKLYDWQSSQQGEAKELTALEKLANDSDADKIASDYGAGWNKGKVQRWLRIEPKLKDIDLRDYFWLSRDRLSGSISGASLVPPMIRSIAQELMEYGSEKILVASATNAKSNLTENEQDLLLGLLEQEILKRSEIDKGHVIFFQLIAAGMPAAQSRYKAALNQISHDKIPLYLHNNIKQIGQKVPAILELLSAYKAGSNIRKAIDGPKK